MKREIVITADGSSTIHLPDWDEQYHSKHGAIQEACHVFIKQGLHYFYGFDANNSKLSYPNFVEVSILEIGFGTGLNAFITLLEAEKMNIKVNYFGVEGYPVSNDEVLQLNYPAELKADNKAYVFRKLHQIPWETQHVISDTFSLTKQQRLFSQIEDKNVYNLIYFDAFGARVQPELWTESIFKKMYDALKGGGVLVTYAAKGSVRRAMQTVGFLVEKLPGPPGKREMLRATKQTII
ncbi:SAM-dependent methyltransferase [Pseudalgibacter alginicilyticus]|uniref:SAM-dependent methyltransferase n=1 Tax=Pseudalgibacter alginicilyticus TaxID=1736674 RepID=A0A0P0D0S3_9FLAO|nr:tRNA (5-methylaminomethyl-2-thiouridine)(34)-methyltransferase MnmD [Pseudalgibacter alginicilyticus]ALJ04433.1 SAM-dependent methyltransferase [Pseudalgibacter alginicilyticus]